MWLNPWRFAPVGTAHARVLVACRKSRIGGHRCDRDREGAGRIGMREVGMGRDEEMSAHPVMSGTADDFNVPWLVKRPLMAAVGFTLVTAMVLLSLPTPPSSSVTVSVTT